jgi:hypothetical protein
LSDVQAVSIVLIGVSGYVLKNSSDYADLIGENSNSLTVICGVTIAIGCFIFLVGLLGCLGAILEKTGLLKAYFAFLVIFVIAELVSGILAFVYKADIQDFVLKELEDKVVNFYGLPEENGINNAVDLLQKEGECCGANNYTDYYGSEFSSVPEYANVSVPISCCKKEVEGCNAANRFGEIADITKIYTKVGRRLISTRPLTKTFPRHMSTD